VRVLLVTYKPVFPYTCGMTLRTYHLFRYLASDHQITHFALIPRARQNMGPNLSGAAMSAYRAFEDLCFRTVYVPLTCAELRYGFVWYSPVCQRALDELLRGTDFEVIYVVSASMAYYLRGHTQLPVIVDLTDSDALANWRQFREAGGIRPLVKWFLFKVFERRVLCRFSRFVLVSNLDADVCRQGLPAHVRIEVIPNGVDTDFFSPVSGDMERENSLVFTGVMSAPPNDQAMRYFVSEIFPLIGDAIRNVSLTIVGPNPTPQLVRLVSDLPNVRLTGYVDDIRPYVRQASLYVAPMVSGTGIKNKILEAWAMGKAVVTTSVGCEGLQPNVRNGWNILVADGATSFAKAVAELLSNPSKRKAIAGAGRKTAVSSYAWNVQALKLESLLREVKETYKCSGFLNYDNVS